MHRDLHLSPAHFEILVALGDRRMRPEAIARRVVVGDLPGALRQLERLGLIVDTAATQRGERWERTRLGERVTASLLVDATRHTRAWADALTFGARL